MLRVKVNPYARSLQSRQVKRTPQDCINESIICKMNSLVVAATSLKFKSVFLHA